MNYIISLHTEKLPEGFYLATSDDVQGLVVQGQTIDETLIIAQDVAYQILQLQGKNVSHIEL
jgi:predicted RNase H-like HicB family nuclease